MEPPVLFYASVGGFTLLIIKYHHHAIFENHEMLTSQHLNYNSMANGCLDSFHFALRHDGLCVESRRTVEHREMVADDAVLGDDGASVSAGES